MFILAEIPNQIKHQSQYDYQLSPSNHDTLDAYFRALVPPNAAPPIAEIKKMEAKKIAIIFCTFISGVIKKYLLAACCFVSDIFDFSLLIHAKGLGVIIHLLVDVFVKETMFVTRDVTMNGSIN